MGEVIEMLEKATGPDLGLDYDIQCEMNGKGEPPAYTASLDAAQTLVPEGCAWQVGCEIDFTPVARVWGQDIHADEFAATPALALCIAALKAKGLRRWAK